MSDSDVSMVEAATRMLVRQRGAWPVLASGHEQLEGALYKQLDVDGRRFMIQCNPGRSKSSRAKVDEKSIRSRPCFLCPDNRPPEQEELPFAENWLILCNPCPIFPQHFTVIRKSHGTVAVAENLQDLLDLAQAFSAGFTLFYNGPCAGASAPDHFHFQACNTGWLPAEEELLGDSGVASRFVLSRVEVQNTEVEVVDAGGRGAVVIKGKESDAVVEVVKKVINLLPPGGSVEPDLNLVALHTGGSWRLAIFPRRAHRPACFFISGPEQLLVSPGAADLAGLVVTTRPEDLERLDADLLTGILGEVARSGNEVKELLAPLTGGGQ